VVPSSNRSEGRLRGSLLTASRGLESWKGCVQTQLLPSKVEGKQAKGAHAAAPAKKEKRQR
jgi:hypothetical protein